MRMVGIVVLVVGVLVLAYGGFSYTKQTHDTKIGPIEISVSEKEQVHVPLWVGVVLAIGGGGLLVVGKK